MVTQRFDPNLSLGVAIHIQLRPPEKAGAGGFRFVIIRAAYLPSSDEDYIPSRADLIHLNANRFTQTPFDAITHHGIANPAIHRETEPAVRQTIRQRTKN